MHPTPPNTFQQSSTARPIHSDCYFCTLDHQDEFSTALVRNAQLIESDYW
jgi:hypothetical protein